METSWLLKEKYGGRVTPAFKRDLERLDRGEHINYVIGWSPFLECRVELSTRPLIPRPETEYWTEQAVKIMKKSGTRTKEVLDIFCGSGCVGLAVLKHVPRTNVDFVDIHKEHFKDINKSLRVNGIDPKRAHCIRSDVFKSIGGRKYDFILANPPYIAANRAVAKSVLSQEPKQALFGGKDGLRYIKTLLKEAGRHLKSGGILILEFDPPQKREIDEYAQKQNWRTAFSKDQYGRWRSVELEPLQKT